MEYIALLNIYNSINSVDTIKNERNILLIKILISN